jgi:CrcB protein
MTWLFVLTAAAGGVGAAARYVLDGWVTRTADSKFPAGTVVINVTGSFALGAVTMLVTQGVLAAPAQTVVGSGLLAGYTTFSTASAQTVDLIDEGRSGAAALYGGGMFAASLIAAFVGMLCARLLG